MLVSPELKEQFERDGYLVLDHLLDAETVGGMLHRAEALAEGQAAPDSGVRFEVEPALAQGGGVSTDTLTAFQRLRKISSLQFDPQYLQFIKHPRLVEVITALRGPDIKLFRTALMVKPAHHGSAKPYHQDSPYWKIDPMDLVSVWIALDDATTENGCMRLVPGAHKLGPLEHVVEGGHLNIAPGQLDTSGEIAAEMKAGGCLFFHSLLPHASSPNKSPNSRRGMVFSYMNARSRWTGAAGGEHEPFTQIAGQSFPGCV